MKMIKKYILTLLILLAAFGIQSQSINQVDDQGQKQGKWIKTYPNGNTRYEGQFKNNRPYGTFTYYTEEGNIEAINRFSDDGIISEAEIYHPNGKLMAEGNFVNKQKNGRWKYYSDLDGKCVAEENYLKGVLDGKSITYYAESGNILEVVNYSKGKREGPYKKYFPDGVTLMSEGFYLNDQLDGMFISYHPNGNIQTKGEYSKGIQTGNWEYFDEEGNELTAEEFKYDKK